MSVIALAIIVVFAMWIAGIGLFALVRPTSARAKIAQFATNWQVNLIEQLGRGAAGAALVIRAPDALTPVAFTWAGLPIKGKTHQGRSKVISPFWPPFWRVARSAVGAYQTSQPLRKCLIGNN